MAEKRKEYLDLYYLTLKYWFSKRQTGGRQEETFAYFIQRRSIFDFRKRRIHRGEENLDFLYSALKHFGLREGGI